MTTVNIQEQIGKTVGRRIGICHPLARRPEENADQVAWRKAFKTPFIPKGVYRFKTHEEADAWTLRIMTRVH